LDSFLGDDQVGEIDVSSGLVVRKRTFVTVGNGSSLCENAFRGVINQIKLHDLHDASRL